MSWTEERVERLKVLHAQGLSGGQIAEALGEVSRNAVIGKAHRLGLGTTGGGRTAYLASVKKERPAPTPRRIFVAPKPAKPPPTPRVRVIANMQTFDEPRPRAPRVEIDRDKAFKALPGSTPRHHTERPANACNWPIGDEGLSCCEPVSAYGWCVAHVRIGRIPIRADQKNLSRALRRWVAA